MNEARVHLYDRRKLHGHACNHVFKKANPKRTRDPAKVTCRGCLTAHSDGDGGSK